jgi:acyl carrier protein
MTKKEFIDLFVEELEIEDTEVKPETQLNELEEWDSMGHMVVIGLVSENFDLKITASDLKALQSVDDLINKIGAEKFES